VKNSGQGSASDGQPTARGGGKAKEKSTDQTQPQQLGCVEGGKGRRSSKVSHRRGGAESRTDDIDLTFLERKGMTSPEDLSVRH